MEANSLPTTTKWSVSVIPTERRAAASEYAAMYAEQNNLDIEYIKEYGWDPYKIFE